MNDCEVTAGKRRGCTLVKTVEPPRTIVVQRTDIHSAVRLVAVLLLNLKAEKDRMTIIKLAISDQTGSGAHLDFQNNIYSWMNAENCSYFL